MKAKTLGRFMRSLRILPFLATGLAPVVSTAANVDLKINGNPLGDYTIMYNSYLSPEVNHMGTAISSADVAAHPETYGTGDWDYSRLTAERLQTELKELTGVTLTCAQWTIGANPAKRIEVGTTDLGAMGDSYYKVEVSGDVLTVGGSRGGTLWHAVDYLVAYVRQGNANLASGLKLEGQHHLYTIACVGDSITKGSGSWDEANLNANFPHVSRSAYPAALGRILWKDALVKNYGLDGATMCAKAGLYYQTAELWEGHPLSRPCEVMLDDAANADLTIIQLGTNDAAGWGRLTGMDKAARKAEYFTEADKLVAAILEKNPKMAFMIGNVPANSRTNVPADYELREIQKAYAEHLNDEGKTVYFADVDKAMTDRNMVPGSLGDVVHLTSAGYCEMGEIYAGFVTDFIPDLTTGLAVQTEPVIPDDEKWTVRLVWKADKGQAPLGTTVKLVNTALDRYKDEIYKGQILTFTRTEWTDGTVSEATLRAKLTSTDNWAVNNKVYWMTCVDHEGGWTFGDIGVDFNRQVITLDFWGTSAPAEPPKETWTLNATWSDTPNAIDAGSRVTLSNKAIDLFLPASYRGTKFVLSRNKPGSSETVSQTFDFPARPSDAVQPFFWALMPTAYWQIDDEYAVRNVSVNDSAKTVNLEIYRTVAQPVDPEKWFVKLVWMNDSTAVPVGTTVKLVNAELDLNAAAEYKGQILTFTRAQAAQNSESVAAVHMNLAEGDATAFNMAWRMSVDQPGYYVFGVPTTDFASRTISLPFWKTGTAPVEPTKEKWTLSVKWSDEPYAIDADSEIVLSNAAMDQFLPIAYRGKSFTFKKTQATTSQTIDFPADGYWALVPTQYWSITKDYEVRNVTVNSGTKTAVLDVCRTAPVPEDTTKWTVTVSWLNDFNAVPAGSELKIVNSALDEMFTAQYKGQVLTFTRPNTANGTAQAIMHVQDGAAWAVKASYFALSCDPGHDMYYALDTNGGCSIDTDKRQVFLAVWKIGQNRLPAQPSDEWSLRVKWSDEEFPIAVGSRLTLTDTALDTFLFGEFHGQSFTFVRTHDEGASGSQSAPVTLKCTTGVTNSKNNAYSHTWLLLPTNYWTVNKHYAVRGVSVDGSNKSVVVTVVRADEQKGGTMILR